MLDWTPHPGFYLEYFFWGRGGGSFKARMFCKECTERCNGLISYENALLSFGSSITSREKVSVHWGN